MATNMAPHNLTEVIAAARYLLKHPDASTEQLMKYVPGPDLPTGGHIVGLDGDQGGVPDRPRHLPHPRDGQDRAAQRAQDRHRGHRAALLGRPGEGHRQDQGPGPGQEAGRHLRPEGPDRPQPGPEPGHRGPGRLQPGGGAGRALPAHPDGGDVRHQQRRPRRRPAAHARPARAADDLRRPPARRHPPAERVPAPQAPGAAAPGRRHPDRAAQHRRGHPGHQDQRRLGRGEDAACSRSSTCPRSRRSTSSTPRCAA